MNRLLLTTAALTCAAAAGHIATLRRQLRTAQRAAATDSLTGLANRTGLERGFAELVVAADDQRIGLLLIDLDGFKRINDTYGHDAGDEVLVAVARRVGRHGFAARLGGDEFVVALRIPQGQDAEHELACRAFGIECAIETPLAVGDVIFRPSVSIGYAHATAAQANLSELLAESDAAMYRAKGAAGAVRGYLAPLDGPPDRAARPPVRTRDRHGVDREGTRL